jgi:hypothetical protein
LEGFAVKLALKILWASPTSLVGLVLAFLLGAFPKRIIRGQVLQFEARWGFWKWLNGRGFVATTFANVSILSPVYIYDLPTQRHEAVHTAQAYVWGPLFLPVYLAQWVAVGFKYGAIPWEQQAYARQSEPGWAI